jgi:hypothetical protein
MRQTAIAVAEFNTLEETLRPAGWLVFFTKLHSDARCPAAAAQIFVSKNVRMLEIASSL